MPNSHQQIFFRDRPTMADLLAVQSLGGVIVGRWPGDSIPSYEDRTIWVSEELDFDAEDPIVVQHFIQFFASDMPTNEFRERVTTILRRDGVNDHIPDWAPPAGTNRGPRGRSPKPYDGPTLEEEFFSRQG